MTAHAIAPAPARVTEASAALPKGPRGVFRVAFQAFLDPIGAVLRWRREYGDPMSVPDAHGKPYLVTGSSAGVRAIFSAPPDTFEPFDAEMLGYVVGETSLIALSVGEHTSLRKLLLPPFHGQRMRAYGQRLRDLTLELTQDLQPGTRFVAQERMHAISLRAIVQLVFGITAPERVARAEQRVADFRRAFVNPLLMLAVLFPRLRRDFWGLGPWTRLRRAIAALRDLFAEQLAEHRASEAERTDILSLLLAARHEDGTALGDPQIFDQLQTLLLAGHTTTGDALSWALYFLGREPQALARLHAELAALGPDAEPEALARAPFLEAVCQETLRLRPSIPTVGRRLRSPLTVAGYALPAGSCVGACALWAHYDPETFPQPDRFLPERFVERTYSPFEFLPFGGGQRRCIGAAFALYEMKLVLATLLSRFTVELVTKKPIGAIQTTALIPRAPIRMRVGPAVLAP